jgi:hypothetical protein
MIEITLTFPEILQAAFVGAMRQVENIRDAPERGHGDDGMNDWQKNIEGALGEMAVASYLNLYWRGKGDKKSPDVGGKCDVRTTTSHNFHLRLHPTDIDDRPYWLVTGKNGSYRIHGWLLAKDGKKPEYWSELPGHPGRPAFFVPQSALHQP